MRNLQNSCKWILVQWWTRGWRNEHLSHPWVFLQREKSCAWPAIQSSSGFHCGRNIKQRDTKNYYFVFSQSWHVNYFPNHIPSGELHIFTNDILAVTWRKRERSTVTILWGCHSSLGLLCKLLRHFGMIFSGKEGIPRSVWGKYSLYYFSNAFIYSRKLKTFLWPLCLGRQTTVTNFVF